MIDASCVIGRFELRDGKRRPALLAVGAITSGR
jgi:hypothetical protein